MNKSIFLGPALLLAMTSTSLAQNATTKPAKNDGAGSTAAAEKDSKTGTNEVKPKAATEDPNYVIGPEDEINVNVWHEQDISRTVPVRPDGKISLPLVNDVQASGLTPLQLGVEITTKLKKFVSDPQVTIIVVRINSQRIFILGEVARAGSFTLLPNMTILEAISSAGGFSPFAKQTKIHVLRKEGGKQVVLPFNYKEAISGQHPEQNIALKAGDTIVVP